MEQEQAGGTAGSRREMLKRLAVAGGAAAAAPIISTWNAPAGAAHSQPATENFSVAFTFAPTTCTPSVSPSNPTTASNCTPPGFGSENYDAGVVGVDRADLAVSCNALTGLVTAVLGDALNHQVVAAVLQYGVLANNSPGTGGCTFGDIMGNEVTFTPPGLVTTPSVLRLVISGPAS